MSIQGSKSLGPNNALLGDSDNPSVAGVSGTNSGGGAGVAGDSDKGDGMHARTASSSKTGIFARNDDTKLAPVGTGGGNGVFGLSSVPNASGVFGENNGGGVGVAGNSDGGDGMQARTGSSSHNGIFARNDSTKFAPGGGIAGGNGVFGLSNVPNASGVFGENNGGGVGVAGNSPDGTGIQGSGKIAGEFHGPVEISGSLKVQGQDLIPLLQMLVVNVSALTSTPRIVVDLPGSGIEGKFRVSGTRFLSSEPITFRVQDAVRHEFFTTKSDADGELLNFEIIFPTQFNLVTFVANDGRSDRAGTVMSNEVQVAIRN